MSRFYGFNENNIAQKGDEELDSVKMNIGAKIVMLRPAGRQERLIQDDRLISPDALVIEKGWVYVPAPQMELTSSNNDGKDATKAT